MTTNRTVAKVETGHQRTGLSVSRARRIVRRVLTSDRRRVWRNSDLLQALDPKGRINGNTLGVLLYRASPASVARAIGMRAIRDGKAVAYVANEIADDLGTHEVLVERLFRANPGPWTIDGVAAALFPDQSPDEHRRHTSLTAIVDRVAKRLGFRKVADPFHPKRRYLYGPRRQA